MRNSLKNKKSIIAARVMLIILLLTSAVNLGACVKKYKYYLFQWVDGVHTHPTLIRVNSYSDTFEINDLTLDLEIGIHKLSLFGKMDDYPKGQYPDGYSNKNIGFVLYICDGSLSETFPYFVDDIQNVDGHLFIKEIPEEQAFSREYGHNSFKCNHIESITIPKEYVSEDRGTFVIKLATYSNPYDSNSLDYEFLSREYIFFILLEYEKISNDQIRITNFRERW